MIWSIQDTKVFELLRLELNFFKLGGGQNKNKSCSKILSSELQRAQLFLASGKLWLLKSSFVQVFLISLFDFTLQAQNLSLIMKLKVFFLSLPKSLIGFWQIQALLVLFSLFSSSLCWYQFGQGGLSHRRKPCLPSSLHQMLFAIINSAAMQLQMVFEGMKLKEAPQYFTSHKGWQKRQDSGRNGGKIAGKEVRCSIQDRWDRERSGRGYSRKFRKEPAEFFLLIFCNYI